MKTRTIEVIDIPSRRTTIFIGSNENSIDFSQQAINVKVYLDNQTTPSKFIDLMLKTLEQKKVTTSSLTLKKGIRSAKLVFETRSNDIDLSKIEYRLLPK